MAKTQTKTAESPLKYSLGQPILGDGDQGVAALSKALNWVYGNRPAQHLSQTCARDGWDATTKAVGTLRAELATALQTIIDTDLWISPDAARTTMLCGAECVVSGGDVVTVTWVFTGSLGSTSVSVTCSAAHNGTERSTSTAMTGFTAGGEWVRLEVKAQVTTGTGTTHTLLEVAVEEEAKTSSLPDPDND